jgi:predicted metal-dependent enzyme (double-stranded beta helix superfamily)
VTTQPTSPTRAYALADFVMDLDRLTRGEPEPRRLTAAIAPLLARLIRIPDAVAAEFRRRPADGRRGRYMLHRASRFNVTAVVWGPGETAGAHDHQTWGVIGVIDNLIEETRYTVRPSATPGGPADLAVRSVTRHAAGAISCLVPGDEVHAMHNPTDRDTVEIHVYGRDLAGLPRHTWASDGTERPLVSPPYLNC